MIRKLLTKYNKLSDPVKATFWYTFCNFLNKGIALLTTPIFTRIMSTEQYGTFAIFQSWFNILIIFTSLNLFLSSFTKGLIKYKKDRQNFASSQLSLTTIITCVFLLIYGINIDFWTNIFSLPPLLMVAMFAELLAMPAYELWLAQKRFDYKYKSVVLLSLSMNIICLATSVIAVLCTDNKVEARAISDVVIKVIFALPLFLIIFSRGKKVVNFKYWKYALIFNLPLLPHYLSNFVLTQSDRIMIGQLVGDTQAGYYSVSYTISTIIMLLITAINSSLTPYIYKSIDEQNKKQIKTINRVTNLIATLIALLCAAVMLFAPEVIKVFAGERYLDAIYIIPPVATSVYFILVYSVFSNIEYFYQKNKNIAIATSFCAIVNIAMNYIGIKLFGYYAAGYTTLLCYVLLAIFHYVFYKKIVRDNMSFIKNKNFYNSKLIFTIGIILCIFTIFITLIYSIAVIRYIIALVLFLIIIVRRKNIMKTINTLFKEGA